MDFEECSEESRNKIVRVSENKMKFVILNDKKNRVRKVIVDDCLIEDDRERCDYLFEIYDPASLVIYVELKKGRKIEKAASQLAATLGHCKKRHKRLEKLCYIVTSRIPKTGPKLQVLRKKFLKNHKVKLKIETSVVEARV